mgnify:CR=1 FL=1
MKMDASIAEGWVDTILTDPDAKDWVGTDKAIESLATLVKVLWDERN